MIYEAWNTIEACRCHHMCEDHLSQWHSPDQNGNTPPEGTALSAFMAPLSADIEAYLNRCSRPFVRNLLLRKASPLATHAPAACIRQVSSATRRTADTWAYRAAYTGFVWKVKGVESPSCSRPEVSPRHRRPDAEDFRVENACVALEQKPHLVPPAMSVSVTSSPHAYAESGIYLPWVAAAIVDAHLELFLNHSRHGCICWPRRKDCCEK
eukprot:1894939-Rhodomonas_salina.2